MVLDLRTLKPYDADTVARRRRGDQPRADRARGLAHRRVRRASWPRWSPSAPSTCSTPPCAASRRRTCPVPFAPELEKRLPAERGADRARALGGTDRILKARGSPHETEYPILMPQMGQSVAEGTIVRWLQEGRRDDRRRTRSLLEVETRQDHRRGGKPGRRPAGRAASSARARSPPRARSIGMIEAEARRRRRWPPRRVRAARRRRRAAAGARAARGRLGVATANAALPEINRDCYLAVRPAPGDAEQRFLARAAGDPRHGPRRAA